MRVLVCGSHTFADDARIRATLDTVHTVCVITAIIHGGAAWVDSIAGDWAKRAGVIEIRVPAKWGVYGNRAGPERNARMLHEHRPDIGFAFPGGPGTRDMVKKMRRAGVQVIEIKY